MITKKKFRRAMEEIDLSLQKQNVEIHARSLHAVGELARKLGINDAIPMLSLENPPLIFTPEYLWAHIVIWYERRYGERVKGHMGPGSVAILIKGQPWEVEMPLVYGRVKLICDPNISISKGLPTVGSNREIPTYNILSAIKDLTTSLANDLNEQELENIFAKFRSGLDALQVLSNLFTEPMIREAYVDLKNAVTNLVGVRQHYGQSKWASLQFAEKMIKSQLTQNEIAFPNSHNLSKLANIARNNSVCDISHAKIDKIQCSAGVRYGEEEISLGSAIEAHEMSLEIIKEVFV